jgi:hypothetical protein
VVVVLFLTKAYMSGFVQTAKVKPLVPAMRVDMIALPSYLSKDRDLQKFSETAQSSSSSLKADTKVSIAHPASHLSAFQKARQAIAKFRNHSVESQANNDTPSKSVSASNKPNNPDQAVPFEGNRLSQGQIPSSNSQQTDKVSYLVDLQQHLQENWYLPMWLQNKNLKAQVRLFLAPSGALIRYDIMKSSGNVEFDALVRSTIEQSDPYPALPMDTKEGQDVNENGVDLGFPM